MYKIEKKEKAPPGPKSFPRNLYLSYFNIIRKPSNRSMYRSIGWASDHVLTCYWEDLGSIDPIDLKSFLPICTALYSFGRTEKCVQPSLSNCSGVSSRSKSTRKGLWTIFTINDISAVFLRYHDDNDSMMCVNLCAILLRIILYSILSLFVDCWWKTTTKAAFSHSLTLFNVFMKKPYLFVVFLNFKGSGTLSSLLKSL